MTYSEKNMSAETSSIQSISTLSSLKSVLRREKAQLTNAEKAAKKNKALADKALRNEAIFSYYATR